MNRIACIALGLLCSVAIHSANAAPTANSLPPDTSTLRASTLPGYAVAQQKCGICHSADYVSFQPPGMNQTQWTSEMTKMQHSYGAPISDDDVKSIGAYLAVAYGSATLTDAGIVAASPAATPVASVATPAPVDVQALLNANACLGCHAIDHKVVGPAFQEISTRYKGNATAPTMLATSIQKGGVGKWGQVAMPPMASLTDAQAKALAAFVLQQ